MKKLFVVSDVHSYFDELMTSLNDNGYDSSNPDHIFISCGDLCDRGQKPIECLDFVNNLPDDQKILILGNHEDLTEEAICRHYFESHDYHNRTYETAYLVTKTNMDNYDDANVLDKMKHNRRWNKYIKSCKNYAEVGNYIFVHGWIPVAYDNDGNSLETLDGMLTMYYNPKYKYYDDWRSSPWIDDWKEARWINGMKMWSKGIIEPGKTIVCGHYHTSWGHSKLHNDGVEWLKPIETYYIDPDTGNKEPHCRHDPFEDDGIIAIDACTAISGIVNCKVLEVTNEDWGAYKNAYKS